MNVKKNRTVLSHAALLPSLATLCLLLGFFQLVAVYKRIYRDVFWEVLFSWDEMVIWDVITSTLLILAFAAATLTRILRWQAPYRTFIDTGALALFGIIFVYNITFAASFISIYVNLSLFAPVLLLVACFRERRIVIRHRKQGGAG